MQLLHLLGTANVRDLSGRSRYDMPKGEWISFRGSNSNYFQADNLPCIHISFGEFSPSCLMQASFNSCQKLNYHAKETACF